MGTPWFCFPISLKDLVDDTLFSPAARYIAYSYFALTLLYLGGRRFRRLKANMARVMMVVNIIVLAFFSFVYAQNATTGYGTSTSYAPQYTLPASIDVGANVLPNIYDPEAITAQDVCPGYNATNVTKTTTGLTADLVLAGTACNAYGNDVENLLLTVDYQSSDRLNVYITPKYVSSRNESWFVLPEQLVPKPSIENSTNFDNDFEFTWSNSPSFNFKVIRQSNGEALFDTTGSKLIYEDQYIEFVSTLPEDYNLYGLGEVIHGFRLGNYLNRTIFAADSGDPTDLNIYGSHSFYLDTRYYQTLANGTQKYVANATNAFASYTSLSHGVFLRNAHPQEVLLRPTNITWRSLGGSIDLYFYSGPTQKEVTQAFQVSTIGLPAMQQYWTFGYHQCRWGYQNWTVLQEVVDRFAAFDIPLETIWTDIDYMSFYRDFQNDAVRYGYSEGKTFLDGLHANGQHYVPIVDSAIYHPNPANASDAYPVFDRGNETQSFMLNPDGSLYIGAVWPGFTVFPDWIGAALNGTGAFDWWTNEMYMWHQNVSFDGIWIDMSEVSSFCVGSCGSNPTLLEQNPVHPPFSLPGEPGDVIYDYPEGFAITNASEAASVSAACSSAAASASSASAASATTLTGSSTASMAASSTSTSYLRTTPTAGVRNVNYPPYVINNVQGDLAVHAVSPNATHNGGIEEYDVHNLFGHQILNATYHDLEKIFPTKRPFIIGRSTFAGSGKWAGHWGGDNTALFYYMQQSIPQALSFSLFGIPMFGTDTCGFNGDSDEELCNRWMMVSAFYSFYRNHNTLSANSQEPYIWASVAEASRKVMKIRYSLLPYIYTTMYHASTSGSTYMRALAWEFPNDPTLAAADRQFMVGDSLMITPVLNQGYTNVSGVFPGTADGEIWYDWYNQTAVSVAPGTNVTIDAPLSHIPVYIRGGKILPMQEPALTTTASRASSWSLLVALGTAGAASGDLYIDDGESVTPNATLYVQFSAANRTLYTSARGTYADNNTLANVTVLGVQTSPTSVSFNGADLSSGSWSWNGTNNALTVLSLGNLTTSGAWASDWTLAW